MIRGSRRRTRLLLTSERGDFHLVGFTLEATGKTAVPINNGSGEQKFRSATATTIGGYNSVATAAHAVSHRESAQGFPLIGSAGRARRNSL